MINSFACFRYLGNNKGAISCAIIGPEDNNLTTDNGWTNEE